MIQVHYFPGTQRTSLDPGGDRRLSDNGNIFNPEDASLDNSYTFLVEEFKKGETKMLTELFFVPEGGKGLGCRRGRAGRLVAKYHTRRAIFHVCSLLFSCRTMH